MLRIQYIRRGKYTAHALSCVQCKMLNRLLYAASDTTEQVTEAG